MRKILLAITVSCVFAFTSCSFFTSSWGTGLKRDLKNTYSAMSTSEIADLLNNPELMNDPESAKMILTILADRDDLNSLSAKEKERVLNLTINTAIPADVLADSLQSISGNKDSSSMKSVLGKVFDSISDTDITAAANILSENDSRSDISSSSVALTTVCLVAQVMNNENLMNGDQTVDKVTETFADVMKNAPNPSSDPAAYDTFINNSIKAMTNNASISSESSKALKAAFNAVVGYRGSDAEVFPGITMDSFFSN